MHDGAGLQMPGVGSARFLVDDFVMNSNSSSVCFHLVLPRSFTAVGVHNIPLLPPSGVTRPLQSCAHI